MTDVRFPILNAMRDNAPAWTRGAFDAVLRKAGAFDETKHPRKPKGDPRGGQFAPNNESASLPAVMGGSEKETIQDWDDEFSDETWNRLFDAQEENFSPQQEQDVAQYTGVTFTQINGALRNGARPQVVDRLESLAAPAPADMVVFRGMGKLRASDLSEGNVVTNNGFTSTSVRARRASDFAVPDGNRRALARIVVPKGTPVLCGGFLSRELILMPGQRFRVGKTTRWRDRHGDEYLIVDYHLLPNGVPAQKSFDASKHPRVPAGSERGGQFAPKGMPNEYGEYPPEGWVDSDIRGPDDWTPEEWDAVNRAAAEAEMARDGDLWFLGAPEWVRYNRFMFGDLREKLTSEEEGALLSYADRSSQAINANARAGIESDAVRLVDSAIAKFQVRMDTKAFSGVSRRTFETIRALQAEGQTTFQNNAFVSTSLDRDVAARHHVDGYWLRINVPAGASALYIQELKDLYETAHGESELLLPRNSRFRIDAVGEKDITLTLLPNTPAQKAFDESEHPRKPRGTEGGGQFAPKDGAPDDWRPTMTRADADRWSADSRLPGAFYRGVGQNEKGERMDDAALDAWIGQMEREGMRVGKKWSGRMLGNGLYFSKGRKLAERYGRVLEVRLNVKNPWIGTFDEWSRQYGRIARQAKKENWGVSPSERINRWAELHGIDAIFQDLGPTFRQVVVFDPKKVVIVKD